MLICRFIYCQYSLGLDLPFKTTNIEGS